MNEKVKRVYELGKDELNEKLRKVYREQKLTPKMFKIARIMDISIFGLILLACIFGDGEDDFITGIIAFVGAGYGVYRLLKPHSEDTSVFEDLDKVTEGVDNLKKYKNGELRIVIDNKKVEKVEKGLKFLPPLLEVSKGLKIMALIPGINIFADETHNYTNSKGALQFLLNGTPLTEGLKYFSNENIEKLKEKEMKKNN